MVVSARLATLAELGSVYGTEDLEDLVEIILIDEHNTNLIRRHQQREAEKER